MCQSVEMSSIYFYYICLDANKKEKKIILLFSLFLLLFISSTILFDTIYRPYCIISTNFYLYLSF